jgi:hypothetical protein
MAHNRPATRAAAVAIRYGELAHIASGHADHLEHDKVEQHYDADAYQQQEVIQL